MAFKNEEISERNEEWVSRLVTYQRIRELSRWVHKFRSPSWIWTVDRERNAYLIRLGGGGPLDDGRMPFAVLIVDGQLVVFNLVESGSGDGIVGREMVVKVHNLAVQSSLEARMDEVKELLRQGLFENVHCRPFADGGTLAKPNLLARWHIKSFSVEFM